MNMNRKTPKHQRYSRDQAALPDRKPRPADTLVPPRLNADRAQQSGMGQEVSFLPVKRTKKRSGLPVSAGSTSVLSRFPSGTSLTTNRPAPVFMPTGGSGHRNGVQHASRSEALGYADQERMLALTDDQKRALCSDRQLMNVWLAYGTAVLALPRGHSVHSLTPAPTHWFSQSGDPMIPDLNCSASALVGRWWAMVSTVRALAGQPLSLPDLPRASAMIAGLLKRITVADMIRIQNTVIENWPMIRESLGEWGTGLPLNEWTLGIQRVEDSARAIMAGQPIQPWLRAQEPADLAGESVFTEWLKHHPDWLHMN